jgi:hypothetical protein
MNRFLVVSLAASATLVHSAPAQTIKLSEDFENMGSVSSGQQGPQGLISEGWIFRNQSDPLGSVPAWQPNGGVGVPQGGAGYLRAWSLAAGGLFGAELSSWAILPPVPNQQAGDVIGVWALDGGHGSLDTFFEIRYSPSGGTSTGSTPSSVGDFTEVLFSSEMPTNPQYVYELLEATVPGSGRLALRFQAPNINSFQTSATLYLDTLTVGEAQGPACGLELPSPGEVVTWDLAGSPYTVCQDLVIPEGATLVIDAGVTVNFDPGNNLIVEGSVIAQGAAAQPVVLRGNNVSGFELRGDLELHHADVDAAVFFVAFDTDCSLEAFDSVFRDDGWITAYRSRSYTRLERCEIQAESLLLHSTSTVVDTRVTNPDADVRVVGFWNIEGLESVAPIAFVSYMQDRLIDNVSVTGVADAPALDLSMQRSSTEFHLGSNNVLQGNLYPVWPRNAGLTPDSTLPLTGNINNAILGMDVANAPLRSRVSIPNLGLPYHFLERGTVIGDVRIDPGTVLKFGPAGGLTIGGDKGTDAAFRGLPGRPIVLERLDPAREWFSLATGPGWHIFEHLDVSGAGVGVVGNESQLFLRDSLIHDCAIGAYPSADGNMYGSGIQFLNNELGLRDDPVNPAAQIATGVHFSGVDRPNIFEGNVVAAKNFGTTNGTLHEFEADNNWWGHETGPFEPNFHPQGQGDEVSFGVTFEPFLTSRPDLSDHRPVVRMKTRVHPVVLPGERIIIEWEAFDDGEIESFDIQVLDPALNLPPGIHFVNLATGLPGSQRSFEVEIPVVGLHPYERFPFRIVAHDDAGNTSFEQFWAIIPHQAPAGAVQFRTPLENFSGGEDIEICYDAMNLSSSFPRFYMETGADDRVGLGPSGHPGTGECTFSPIRIPHASTDRARIALRAEGNFNRDEWYFTDYFTIRPDPRFGDAPPTIDVTSPSAGQVFVGGRVVPIAWTASDDKGLREFRIQASFNGGYTFHTIETSLPPSARRYDWRLPASRGIDDVRIRVVAVDTMMQNTSAGDDRIIEFLPGSGCYADCDGSGTLDVFDFLCFQDSFTQGDPYADCDGNATLDVFDFLCFQDAFVAGCP